MLRLDLQRFTIHYNFDLFSVSVLDSYLYRTKILPRLWQSLQWNQGNDYWCCYYSLRKFTQISVLSFRAKSILYNMITNNLPKKKNIKNKQLNLREYDIIRIIIIN